MEGRIVQKLECRPYGKDFAVKVSENFYVEHISHVANVFSRQLLHEIKTAKH